jgi:hypothetical protein
MSEESERDLEPVPARLVKIKRPPGTLWFDLEVVAEDGDGTWLLGRPGAAWGTARDQQVLTVRFAMLLQAGRPWAAWWVADDADPRIEIDVCLPVERTATGWRFVDLELDPVRHENDGRVEIDDEDEYEEALRKGWMSARDGELARATADSLAQVLRDDREAWISRGWRLLGCVDRGGARSTPG